MVRDAAVTEVAQDDGGVVVTAGGRSHRAGWLVAADGGHSAVRRLLGAAFPGRPRGSRCSSPTSRWPRNRPAWPRTGSCRRPGPGSCCR
ncbi:FAD-dependent oxidoreductase [Pseudonocardia benzenivorans]